MPTHLRIGRLGRPKPGHPKTMQPNDSVLTLDLPSDVEAAALAREFVAQHTASLPAELVDDATLLVSELVTNAVLHGKPAVTLRLSLDPPLIGVAVDDAGELLPPTGPTPADVDQTHGRGLFIVDHLASTWGTIAHAPGPGKTVWFHIRPAVQLD